MIQELRSHVSQWGITVKNVSPPSTIPFIPSRRRAGETAPAQIWTESVTFKAELGP